MADIKANVNASGTIRASVHPLMASPGSGMTDAERAQLQKNTSDISSLNEDIANHEERIKTLEDRPSGGGTTTETMNIGSSVKWNEPMLDIVNKKRLSNAIKLSEDGHLAHNSCIVDCGGAFAIAWSEDTSGGTSDNQTSSNVHGKLKFANNPYSTFWKVDGDDVCLPSNNVTYDLFPIGTTVEGKTIVSDSDHMIYYDSSTLHVFAMVKFSDNIIRICHTYGTVEKSGSGLNKSITYTSSNVYEIVRLNVDGVVGDYDFTRVDSKWMKTPQINTNPYVSGTDYKFALSINGKAIAFMRFSKSNPSEWIYESHLETTDVNLEVSVCEINWISNTIPNKIIAYRTKKGYVCLVGMLNANVLSKVYIPATDTRVRIVKVDNFKFLLSCGNVGRGSASIYMFNFDNGGNLTNPLQIWESSNSKVTDYVDMIKSANAIVLCGTNGSAKSKNGVSICTMLYDSARVDYESFNENLYNSVANISATDDHINDLINSALGVIENGTY